jgi:hypothetical protein
MAQEPGSVVVNIRTLKLMAVIVVVMGAILLLMERADKGDTVADGETLFPALKEQINDIDKLTVSQSGDTEALTLYNDGSTWLVAEKGDFPADVGRIRDVLLAVADAKTIERKTANPDRYEQLGVHDGGTKLKIEGPDISYGLIIGNAAQTNYRYVRLADQPQSWLVDKNPDLPAEGGGWLQSDIVDIDPTRVSAVTTTHNDGTEIRLTKATAEDTDFVVADIPAGRELSYPAVANGIGGALNDLALDDVRKGTPADAAVVTVVETFDGLRVTAQVEGSDDEFWVSLSATGSGDASHEADEINTATAGWMYSIPGYKAVLLQRSWEDILKAEVEVEAESE